LGFVRLADGSDERCETHMRPSAERRRTLCSVYRLAHRKASTELMLSDVSLETLSGHSKVKVWIIRFAM